MAQFLPPKDQTTAPTTHGGRVIARKFGRSRGMPAGAERIQSEALPGLVITYAKHAVNQAKRAKAAASR
jgi:hypothetical protein